MNDPYLKITPLGGLGEIGLNCQLWESNGNVVMVDCGLMFPDDSHLGVDVLIPHFAAVQAVKDKLCGIILTHGHEDHIGALPWILTELKGTTIYGSQFTLALVEHKLKEFDLHSHVKFCPVTSNSVIDLGGMKFHFFPVCHSIPHGFGLGVETPAGKIIHSGDFKIDNDPLDGQKTDLDSFRTFAGEEGVRLLMSDSTNIMREGNSLTERDVKSSLAKIFEKACGRIVVTLFSSHIQRIQEVFDLAREYERNVVISGKSLANNIEIAVNTGDLVLPPYFYNAYSSCLLNIPDEKLVIIVTGAQGEPLSALSRMVGGEHRQLSIRRGDTVIMSSRMIPGNAKQISRLINEMYRCGAEVLYEGANAVHASGHAHKEELRTMIQLAKPQLFMPIHGEYRHLVAHGRLAVECGVKPENVLLVENGNPICALYDSVYIDKPVPVDYTLVDGKGVGDVGSSVLKERRILGDEGIVIVALVIDSTTGSVLSGPEITSRGFVFEPQLNHLLEDAKCLVLDEIEQSVDPDVLHDNIRASLRRFFRRILERDPLVVPVISVV